jgi:hypothetical protein
MESVGDTEREAWVIVRIAPNCGEMAKRYDMNYEGDDRARE